MISVLVEKESINNMRFLLTMEGLKSALSLKRVPYRTIYKIEDIDKDERIVIIFGLSLKWIETNIKHLKSLNIHPLVFGTKPRFTIIDSSYVTQDYRGSFFNLTKYMIKKYREIKRIAFLGFNPDSPHDLYKLEGFEKACMSEHIDYAIFNNLGNSEKTIKDFLKKEEQFDYVCCSNDLLAVLYLSLSKNAINKHISGFGGALILNHLKKDILTTSIDYVEAGKALGNLYFFLAKQEIIYPVSITLPSFIQIKNHRFEIEEALLPIHKEVDFFHDAIIEQIDAIEKMLLVMDDLDYKILNELKNGKKYEDISAEYYLSLSTIKYRLNKMLGEVNLDNKKELFMLLDKFHINMDKYF